MKTTYHIIYLPGLGDKYSFGQSSVLKVWRFYGLQAHYHQIGWADGESFMPKLRLIVDNIDLLTKSGTVSLVGVSAGASAALNAYAERRSVVSNVVCICGKLKNPQTISEKELSENPAFRDSMELLPTSLSKLNTQDRHKILSIHPLIDNAVPPQDTMVEGAKERTIPTIGHVLSVAYAITLGSLGISRFIKYSSQE